MSVVPGGDDERTGYVQLFTMLMSAVVARGAVLMLGPVRCVVFMPMLPSFGVRVGRRLLGRLVVNGTVPQLSRHRFQGGSSKGKEHDERQQTRQDSTHDRHDVHYGYAPKVIPERL